MVVGAPLRGRLIRSGRPRRAAAATTAQQVREVLMQVYAGVPAANTAFRSAKAAYQEMAQEGAR